MSDATGKNSSPARLRLARKDGRLSLRLSLLPIAADRPLAEPLKVTFGDPKWP
jgi:hypothetical protein